MADEKQVEMLKRSVEEWNEWRRENPEVKVDLKEADFQGSNLIGHYHQGVNLYGADLNNANFNGADLKGADLGRANLISANLAGSNLLKADLGDARLNGALLYSANLRGAKLGGAYLEEANLTGAFLVQSVLKNTNFTKADLSLANFTLASTIGILNLEEAILHRTVFAEFDLSTVDGLMKCIHTGPSIIDKTTLLLSGTLPDSFLKGCGLADWEIEQSKLLQPDLSNEQINDIIYRIYDLRATQAVQISPLFISYSHANSMFVEKLESLFIEKGIRFWRDTHDMVAGRIDKQIDRGIRLNDVVLLVLSEDSVKSEWIQYEVQKAIDIRRETGKDTLCPVSLDDSWKDADWPRQIKQQVEYFKILDFSKWEDEKVFEKQFSKLLQGLDIFYK